MAEWLVSLAASALLAGQLRTLLAPHEAQSALSYYVQEPGVRVLHVAGAGIDAALVFSTLALIWLPERSRAIRRAMAGLAVLGIGLVWWELVRAATPNPVAVYRLSELPFRPTNNSGILGAQAFFMYLLAKCPSSSLGRWSIWVKALLVGAFWLLQLAVWDVVRAR